MYVCIFLWSFNNSHNAIKVTTVSLISIRIISGSSITG